MSNIFLNSKPKETFEIVATSLWIATSNHELTGEECEEFGKRFINCADMRLKKGN